MAKSAAIAVGLLLALGARPCLGFGSNLPCQYAYNAGGTPQPSKYAPPWDVITSGNPLLATVGCATGTVVTVGGGTGQYVSKNAFYSTDGNTWVPITLSGTGAVGNWITSAATANLGLTAAQITGWNYIEFIVATKVATGWAVGGCTKPRINQVLDCVPHWSVQAFYQPPQLVASVALSGNVFPALNSGYTIGTVSVTMNAPTPAFAGTLAISGVNSCGFTLSGTSLLAGPHCQGGVYTDWNVTVTSNNNAIPVATFPESATAWVTNNITPNSASFPDTTTNGATMAQETCTNTSNVTCAPVTWSISGAPSYLSINPNSGLITFNRNLTPTDNGQTFTVTSSP